MKKMTVIGKLLLVFRPKKNDILTEAENIVNSYIGTEGGLKRPRAFHKITLAMNTAIIALTVVLAFMLYRLLM